MKTIWKILGGIGLLLVIAFAGGIGKMIGKTTTDRFFEGKNEGALDSALMQAASEINANLPMMVDSETRLDATVGMNKRFRYNYTLINYSANEIEPKAIVDAMQDKLINNVCTSKEMEVFVKNSIPVTYAYFGKNGKQITVITVSPSQCKSS